jgi:hypothetical protein
MPIKNYFSNIVTVTVMTATPSTCDMLYSDTSNQKLYTK